MYSVSWNPAGRFGLSQIEWQGPPPTAKLQIIEDHTRNILSHNKAATYGFSWSLNPYRGCTHACAYCYARGFHEYLDLGAGSDFERKISVKLAAPALLRDTFLSNRWRGDLIAFSGVTDCYQPLERRYQLTRQCLEVCAEFRNPVTIITRSPLILRDIDVLLELHRHQAVKVIVSIPILDPQLCRAVEPGAPSPRARLRAISELSQAGLPVGLSLAPVIPGLNDRLIPQTLQQARAAGAQWAWMGLVRMATSVAEVFACRVREALPNRAEAILAKIDRARPLSSDGFTRDTSIHWQMTERLFAVWHERLQFEAPPETVDPSPFQRPGEGRQLALL